VEYFRVRINSIDPNTATTFDLYVQIGERLVLYRRAGEKIEAAKIGQLEGKDVFFVLETERQTYKDYVHSRINDEDLDTPTKALILRETSISLVEELFEHPDVNVALQGSKGVIDSFVDFMGKEPQAMAHLIGLSSHDFYTYNHSLDVSIYSLGLGQAAGYTSATELTELGQGSLLHDIGKRHVNAEIICKKGPLDPEEWAQMKLHPTFGLKILMENPGFTDPVRACIFEHHENHAGNGYPQQLTSQEIHPMARIVALVDTYDALTTKRSYNEPMTPHDALEFMKTKLAARFDPDLLKAMYSVLFNMESVQKGA
jgi:HD-GYP domain-containing protein (c-di-GMP phosphodiesterase class II)